MNRTRRLAAPVKQAKVMPAAVWNVCVPVVMNLQATTGADAQRRLVEALRSAGFEPVVDVSEVRTEPFEAEEGTPADRLPVLLRLG